MREIVYKGILLIILFGCIGMLVFAISGFVNGEPNYEGNKAEFESCIYNAPLGYHWDGEKQECVPRQEVEGCITLERMEMIEVLTLPKKYENLTNSYYGENLTIRFVCNYGDYKRENYTCQEQLDEDCRTGYCSDTIRNINARMDYYKIYGEYGKSEELCWNKDVIHGGQE